MRAPSFRCTDREEDGALILHYYSDRPGLESIVIGIVKVGRRKIEKNGPMMMMMMTGAFLFLPLQAVVSKLHGTEVEVSVLSDKAVNVDHVQFLITEKEAEEEVEKERAKALVGEKDDLSPQSFPFLSNG